MIPEKEREALMRLTMCAKNQCAICKYSSIFTHKDCDMMITENMHVLADALMDVFPQRVIDDGKGRKKNGKIHY